MNNSNPQLIGEIYGNSFFVLHKPEPKVCKCGEKITPIYCEGRGYVKYNQTVCDKCLEKIKDDELFAIRAMRRGDALRKTAICQGAPPAKANKVTSNDYDKIQFVFTKEDKKKKSNIAGILNLVKNNPILIQGESGVGKTHLGVYLFLGLFSRLLEIETNEFLWTDMLSLHQKILGEIFHEETFVGQARTKKILVFTFGEYQDELIQKNGKATSLAQRIIFKILEHRLEYGAQYGYITIFITPLTNEQIGNIYSVPVLGRLIEMCHVIELKKVSQRRLKIAGAKEKILVEV